jgi:hypothetical protein
VNDTGAIAYFSDHPTFDVCGLTTEGEGRYWVSGAASRFEHYEHLAAEHPGSLPQYFIVYPEWMAMNEVLGAKLHEATVTDSTILGGQTMVAYEADYSRLGTGERPWTALKAHMGEVAAIDTLDVADLDSERVHAYELLGAREGVEVLTEGASPEGVVVVDGGRRERERERFRVRFEAVGPVLAVARIEASETAHVSVIVDGAETTSFLAEPGGWREAIFPLENVKNGAVIDLVPDAGRLTTYHYWFFALGG